MAAQSERSSGDVNLTAPSTATAADRLRLDDEVSTTPSPVPAVSGAHSVSSGDSNSITAAAQRDAMFSKKLAFPLNLTRMLESVHGEGYAHVVHWSQSGKSFVICDVNLLLRDVLPRFFKNEGTKIRSFYRKLNRWGFSMTRKSAYSPNNIWHHPEFHRSAAVRYLNRALETGEVTDFLYTGSKLKGRKRRGYNSVNCETSVDDDCSIDSTAMDGRQTSECPSILRSRAPLSGSMPSFAVGTSSLSRNIGKLSQSYSSIV